MKHAIKLSSLILASIFAVVACEKENNTAEYKAGETISITATLPSVPAANPASKVDFTQGDGSIDLAWSESDKLTIINEDTDEYSVFTLTSVSGAKATFTGTAISGDSFTVLYPGTITSVADMDSHSFVGQTQTGNANLAHLKTAWTAKITGLSDFSDVKFAAPAGGSFDQSGILKFYLQMPDYVSTVTNVAIESPSAVFFIDNDATQDDALSLALSSVTLDAKHAFTAYLAISQKDSDTISTGETVIIKVVDGEGTEWKKEITLTEDFSLQAGKVNVITLNKDDWDTIERYAGGTGVDGDPWIITQPIHMVHMNEDLVNGTTKYFKLGADIDMTSVTGWKAANAVAVSSKFDKGINFDGNGKTISNFTCTADEYPSLFGVLFGTVKNLTIDHATINGTGKAGVVGGYIGTSTYTATVSGVTVKNSSVTANNYAGGFAGQVGAASTSITGCNVINTTVNSSADRAGGFVGYVGVKCTITDCHSINTTVSSTGSRIGGFAGQLDNKESTISECTAEDVTVSGNINIGGFVGVCYNGLTACTSSGTVSSTNTASNADIGLGGLAGYFEGASIVISKCYSSVTINQTTNGRDIGGLVGKMLAGTIEKSYATGNVSGIQRNVGGLVGLVTLTKDSATIRNCYATGNVAGDAYSGGLVGLHEKGTVNISNSYASGNATGAGFAMGGLVGVIGASTISVSKCAAWNGSVTAASIGSGNWSSGAVVGVTNPICTITDTYRNPAMSLTAYWVPAADYQHPNVSSSHPLVKQDGTETTATSTSSGQDGYPQFPYHGKVEAGKTLSELASTTLGWDSAIWDFSGALPTLK